MSIFKKLSNIQENVLLAPYTTFKIGGPAKYFFVAKNSEDLVKATKTAKEEDIPHFILAGGANILVSDQGFDGLAIKIQNSKFKIQNSKILAEAGTKLSELVGTSVEAGLTGLEWAAGIPGTIGGAVRGNAGAFGSCMADVIKKVKVLNYALHITHYTLQDLKFSYRDSIFKHNNDIILSVELELQKGDKENNREKVKKYLKIRGEKHSPIKYHNAGSIFKNIPIKDINKTKFLKGLDISEEEFNESVKGDFFPTAKVIEALGLKGKKIGGAMISEKHANFIVNTGRAKADEVIMLISLVKMKVREKVNIQLQEEVQLVGF